MKKKAEKALFYILIKPFHFLFVKVTIRIHKLNFIISVSYTHLTRPTKA